MEKAWDKILLIAVTLAGILLAGMLLFTSPSGVGPLGLLLFLMLCYVVFLGLAVLICRLFFKFRAFLDKSRAHNIVKKSYYYGAAVAVAPLILLVSQSFGGITILEVVLVGIFEFVLCFLIAHDIL